MTARLDSLPAGEAPAFMSVRQVARYLQLNEKKIYALLKAGEIPGTKITGKWLFPRELIDRWVLDSAHGGLMQDRLLVCGGDDPLLYRVFLELTHFHAARALISYCPGGTRLGLDLLQNGRADASALHWGPEQESGTRHPALMKGYPKHRQWILLRLFQRETGVLLAPDLAASDIQLESLLPCARNPSPLRWCLRPQGSGSQRFLEEALGHHVSLRELTALPEPAASEREAASRIASGVADCAPGCRASASEFNLGFLPLGIEAFDLVLPNGIYFRKLFQQLLEQLQSPATARLARQLGGYDLSRCGQIIWSGS